MILIGISGKKRVGKDTVAEIITRLCHCPSKIIGFADPLKDEVAAGCQVSNSYIEKHKKEFRPMLQWWGTDFRRKLCSEDYWVRQIGDLVEKDLQYKYDLIIIKDVRFINEAHFIAQHGGYTIRVERHIEMNQADNHLSETEMDGYACDYVIDNCSTLEDLTHKTFDILKLINQKIKHV